MIDPDLYDLLKRVTEKERRPCVYCARPCRGGVCNEHKDVAAVDPYVAEEVALAEYAS